MYSAIQLEFIAQNDICTKNGCASRLQDTDLCFLSKSLWHGNQVESLVLIHKSSFPVLSLDNLQIAQLLFLQSFTYYNISSPFWINACLYPTWCGANFIKFKTSHLAGKLQNKIIVVFYRIFYLFIFYEDSLFNPLKLADSDGLSISSGFVLSSIMVHYHHRHVVSPLFSSILLLW